MSPSNSEEFYCDLVHVCADLYYEAFPNDRLFTKCLVYAIYCIQLVGIILITVDAFAIFGYGFGDSVALLGIHFAWFTSPVITSLGLELQVSISIFDTDIPSSLSHRPILLRIPDPCVIKISDRPCHDRGSTSSPFFLYPRFSRVQASLAVSVSGCISGRFTFEGAGDILVARYS